MTDPIVVVGGGAAGIFAAIGAAEKKAPVVLLEKNARLGLKLLITGKGRSNLTNTAPLDHFVQQFPGHGRFLYSAFANLSNNDLISFFHRLGVELKVERGGRVFPVSDRSKDVVSALTGYLTRLKVDVRTNTKVLGLLHKNGRVTGVMTEQGTVAGRAVIIATGGLSYPRTGSTGDGYAWARAVGHTVTDLRPSLVPLETEEKWVADVQGLTLKNVKVTVWGPKKRGEEFGEMLFTHFGVSGPIILTLSRLVVRELEQGPVRLTINLKPALNRETLERRLLRDFDKYSGKHLKNALKDLLPQKLIEPVLKLSRLEPHKPVHQVTKQERQLLLDTLQGLPLTVTAPRPIAEAIVTSGGVALKEINPKTMESKILSQLYFAGEILDVDGYTGGYNLQAAFSTGYLAGQSAAAGRNE
ncbi:MAG: NAD(P)/FAD-dependent oxidoreductase [Clostridia bacterium]|nr:NAD(P)/FAD-dependent oxidoreductase [Clostridia bacterium]